MTSGVSGPIAHSGLGSAIAQGIHAIGDKAPRFFSNDATIDTGLTAAFGGRFPNSKMGRMSS